METWLASREYRLGTLILAALPQADQVPLTYLHLRQHANGHLKQLLVAGTLLS